jgi:cytidylate kinase
MSINTLPSAQPTTITMDGPAASGKSTLGKMLADKLGYTFFDTGAMYRALTWIALQRHLNPQDETQMTLLAEESDIDVRTPSKADGRNCDIFANGQDITWEIRRPEVETHVSVVSAYPGVRRALSAQQRRIGLRGTVVMVGRDIGTVVLPEADLKIYLVASPEERARRRTEELRQRGETADYKIILEGIRQRDLIDSTRTVAPLRPAPDAVILETDHLDIDQVFQKTLTAWQVVCQNREDGTTVPQ